MDNNQNNKMEEFFRKSLEQFNDSPSDLVWEDINTRLDADLPFYHNWTSWLKQILPVLVAMGIVGIAYFQINQKVEGLENQIATLQETLDQQNESNAKDEKTSNFTIAQKSPVQNASETKSDLKAISINNNKPNIDKTSKKIEPKEHNEKREISGLASMDQTRKRMDEISQRNENGTTKSKPGQDEISRKNRSNNEINSGSNIESNSESNSEMALNSVPLNDNESLKTKTSDFESKIETAADEEEISSLKEEIISPTNSNSAQQSVEKNFTNNNTNNKWHEQVDAKMEDGNETISETEINENKPTEIESDNNSNEARQINADKRTVEKLSVETQSETTSQTEFEEQKLSSDEISQTSRIEQTEANKNTNENTNKNNDINNDNNIEETQIDSSTESIDESLVEIENNTKDSLAENSNSQTREAKDLKDQLKQKAKKDQQFANELQNKPGNSFKKYGIKMPKYNPSYSFGITALIGDTDVPNDADFNLVYSYGFKHSFHFNKNIALTNGIIYSDQTYKVQNSGSIPNNIPDEIIVNYFGSNNIDIEEPITKIIVQSRYLDIPLGLKVNLFHTPKNLSFYMAPSFVSKLYFPQKFEGESEAGYHYGFVDGSYWLYFGSGRMEIGLEKAIANKLSLEVGIWGERSFIPLGVENQDITMFGLSASLLFGK